MPEICGKLPLTREIVVATIEGTATERVPCTDPVAIQLPIGERELVMIPGPINPVNRYAQGYLVDVATGARVGSPSEVEHFPVDKYTLAELIRVRALHPYRTGDVWKARIHLAETANAEYGLTGIGLIPDGSAPAQVKPSSVPPKSVPAKVAAPALAATPEARLANSLAKREQELGGLFG